MNIENICLPLYRNNKTNKKKVRHTVKTVTKIEKFNTTYFQEHLHKDSR
nr:MAG TPA: hypothetical protein [Caudoviricetes sp.]